MYQNIEKCADKDYLFEHLGKDSLKEIDTILGAYFGRRIDFVVPRDKEGQVEFDGEFSVVVKDRNYKETGNEILVLKWVEDFEDTGFMVDCFGGKE